MKYKEITSAILGTAFFAIPYVGLMVPILPSLAIGATAFAASELVFSGIPKKKTLEETNRPLFLTLKEAKNENKYIIEKIPAIEDEEMKKDLLQINETISKIISTVEKNPKKVKDTDNLFEYYLPVLIKILDRYDEIENQRLTSKEGKKFLASVGKMIKEAKDAFNNILSNIYESDIMDADAEMKVFIGMVKSDGIGKKELELEREDDKNE